LHGQAGCKGEPRRPGRRYSLKWSKGMRGKANVYPTWSSGLHGQAEAPKATWRFQVSAVVQTIPLPECSGAQHATSPSRTLLHVYLHEGDGASIPGALYKGNGYPHTRGPLKVHKVSPIARGLAARVHAESWEVPLLPQNPALALPLLPHYIRDGSAASGGMSGQFQPHSLRQKLNTRHPHTR
jgi:hypothetical protein